MPKIEKTGTQIIGISYDSVEVLSKFANQGKITFPLLSDPGSKIIRAYELFNKEAAGKAAGVPYPGTFLIDKQGVIRAKLFLDGYKERHSVADLIKAAESIK